MDDKKTLRCIILYYVHPLIELQTFSEKNGWRVLHKGWWTLKYFSKLLIVGKYVYMLSHLQSQIVQSVHEIIYFETNNKAEYIFVLTLVSVSRQAPGQSRHPSILRILDKDMVIKGALVSINWNYCPFQKTTTNLVIRVDSSC